MFGTALLIVTLRLLSNLTMPQCGRRGPTGAARSAASDASADGVSRDSPTAFMGLRLLADGSCRVVNTRLSSHTAGMTQRVGPKGQVVIPKPMRDELGLEPGSEVEFELDGESVRVLRAGAAAAAGLRGRYRASGLADALLADRVREPR